MGACSWRPTVAGCGQSRSRLSVTSHLPGAGDSGDLAAIQGLARRTTIVPHPPGFLPTPPTSFVGRVRELETCRRLLLSPDVRLLTLTGPGGIGKTRLALALAAAVADRFRDGIYFVDLAPITD